MLSIAQMSPPNVRFEQRSIEDRAKTLEAGRPIYKDVNYVHVTPKGGKDTVERIADEWIAQLRENTNRNYADQETLQYNRALLKAVMDEYSAWKEGVELPVNGTAIRMCPAFSKAEIETCISLGIRTLEDLANCTEEALGRIGMGARSLKLRATEYLASSNDIGKVVGKLNAAIAENEDLKNRILSMEDALKNMPAAKRGRPAKEYSEAA